MPFYSVQEIRELIEGLYERIASLELQVSLLQSELNEEGCDD